MPSAMENDGAPSGMSEAHLLAPWHATGQLDEAEMRELDELAKQDPAFARVLQEAKQEAEAAIFLNEALGEPPQAVWERVSRSIELESQDRPVLRLARLAQHHELAADQIGTRVGLMGGEPAVIAAIGRAVEWIGDITEKRPRSEVGHA